MSSEENTAVARRFMEALFTGNLRVIEKLLDETYADGRILHEEAQPAKTVSNEERKAFVRDFYTINRDVRGTCDVMIGEGDKVAFTWTMHWTEVATGKPVTYRGMETHRFVDGKIAESWEFYAAAD
jgi:ketosteroid isomerase-like protein